MEELFSYFYIHAVIKFTCSMSISLRNSMIFICSTFSVDIDIYLVYYKGAIVFKIPVICIKLLVPLSGMKMDFVFNI